MVACFFLPSFLLFLLLSFLPFFFPSFFLHGYINNATLITIEMLFVVFDLLALVPKVKTSVIP